MAEKFQRTKAYAYVKLGSRQKSLRRYKRPTGRHNKMRQKWRGRTPMVEVGYKNQANTRGLINEKIPVLVSNLNDLKNLKKENIAIISNIGNKKKFEVAKEAMAKKIEVSNLNLSKFIKKMEKKIKNHNKDKNKAEAKK